MSNAQDVDLAIRLAETADAEVLAGLMRELGYATRTSEMTMRLETIAADARYRTFVAVSNGKICGMIGTVCYFSYEHNNPDGRILALVVSKDARRAGVGRRLIAAAESDFAQRNIQRVAVNTHLTRKEAHKFYERTGYTSNGFRFVKTLAPLAD